METLSEGHNNPLSKNAKGQTAYNGGHNTEVAYVSIWIFSSNGFSIKTKNHTLMLHRNYRHISSHLVHDTTTTKIQSFQFEYFSKCSFDRKNI